MAHAPEQLPTPPGSPKSDAGDNRLDPTIEAIYGPLPLDPQIPETRFFKIKSAAWSDKIECKLEKFALRRRIKYYALSYAWGETGGLPDPSPTEEISINGHTFQVSANLAAALRAFRRSQADKYLWADAICHNQKNKKELNVQVGRMRDIYIGCQEVHVWLGKEAQLHHHAGRLPADDGSSVKWTSAAKDHCPDMDATENCYEPSREDDMKVRRYVVQLRPVFLQVSLTT